MVKLLGALALMCGLSGCAGGGGVLGRDRPDEFAVSRQAPLVIPPDFSLRPPAAGTPTSQGSAGYQALEAMFGGRGGAIGGGARPVAARRRRPGGARHPLHRRRPADGDDRQGYGDPGHPGGPRGRRAGTRRVAVPQ